MMFYTGCGAAYKEQGEKAHKSFSFPEPFRFSQKQRKRKIYGCFNGGRLLTTLIC